VASKELPPQVPFRFAPLPRAGLTLLKNFVFLKTAKIWRIENVQENRERDPRGVKPVTSADSNRTRVSPRVAMRELHHRGKKIVAGMAANHAPPANKSEITVRAPLRSFPGPVSPEAYPHPVLVIRPLMHKTTRFFAITRRSRKSTSCGSADRRPVAR
jgi:hypothetical protein